MTNQPEQTPVTADENFTSDLIGISDYQFDKPKKKKYLPWHRPRKQFVREKQWSEQIQLLISETVPGDGVIRYLGLPGDDLLDLRHFHDKICTPNGLKLKFLGFNRGINAGTDNKAEVEISLDEVNRLPNVDDSSLIIGDDLTSIAKTASFAWQKSLNMGPFDIINLDLCDSIAKQPLNGFEQTHYNTLQKLMTLQARRPNPWLLLLTTRTDAEGIDSGVFELLKGVYLDNVEHCNLFRDASLECFSVNDLNSFLNYCENSAGFSNVFLTSLCKWILKLGMGQNPQAKLEVRNVFGYKVNPIAVSPDLISVAIKVTPMFGSAADSVGLANQDFEPLNECSLATKVLRKIYGQKDVDQILATNATLMSEMMQATTTLLQQARYDIDEYQSWVNGGDAIS